MLYRFYSSIPGILLAVILLTIFGCSGSDPASPSLVVTKPDERTTVSSEPSMLWGYWDTQIDTETWEVSLVPLRTVEFTVNVTMFMQPPAGSITNLKILVTDVSEWFDQGKLTVDVGLSHPFPGLDMYTGHDVRGVFIAPGDSTASFNSDIRYSSLLADQPKFLNADGLTRWFNPSEFGGVPPIFSYTPGALGTDGDFNATINPYKYFAENIGNTDDPGEFFEDPQNISDRGQFRAGSVIHRDYELQFPDDVSGPQLTFQYAVTANWVEPDEIDPGDLPGSFPPEANAYEPVHLSIADNSTLFYASGDAGGDISLDLEMYAWPVSAGGSLTERITGITIDSTNGLIPGDFMSFDSAYIESNTSPGLALNSSVVSIDIPNCTPPAEEDQEILIVIETDSDYSNDGAGITYPDGPLASYFLHYVPVSGEPAELTVTSIDPDSADQHTYVDDAIITGTHFVNITSVRLEMDTIIIEADSFTIDSATQITADFDLAGAMYGLYDVVVENASMDTGVLVEGFEVLLVCGETAPAFDSVYTFNEFVDCLFELTVMTDGPYEGWSIFGGSAGVPGEYYQVFDNSTQADNTDFSPFPVSLNGNPMVLECANGNGLMAFGVPSSWYRFDFVDQSTGAVVQSVSNNHEWQVRGDFDGNDDFWAIVLDWDSYPLICTYWLQHYTYDSSNPTSPYSLTEEWNINGLFRDDYSDTQKFETFGDLVMDPSGDYAYVLTGISPIDGHKLDKLDLTGSSPQIIESYDLSGENLNTDCQYNIAQSRAVRMEIDTTDENLVPCRIVVVGSEYAWPDWVIHLYRFDGDLNLIDSSTDTYHNAGGTKFWGFGLDTVNDVLVHLNERPYSGTQSSYGISELPTDW